MKKKIAFLDFLFRKFQEFYKIPITGIIDPITMAKMKESRCGIPDFSDAPVERRRIRAEEEGKMILLSWRIINYSEKFPKEQQKYECPFLPYVSASIPRRG